MTRYAIIDRNSHAQIATLEAGTPLDALSAYVISQGFSPYTDDQPEVLIIAQDSAAVIFTNTELEARAIYP